MSPSTLFQLESFTKPSIHYHWQLLFIICLSYSYSNRVSLFTFDMFGTSINPTYTEFCNNVYNLQ